MGMLTIPLTMNRFSIHCCSQRYDLEKKYVSGNIIPSRPPGTRRLWHLSRKARPISMLEYSFVSTFFEIVSPAFSPSRSVIFRFLPKGGFVTMHVKL